MADNDKVPNVYFSYTGCVPQEPWSPSSSFLRWMQQQIDMRRAHVRNEAWIACNHTDRNNAIKKIKKNKKAKRKQAKRVKEMA